eukprot:scaffold100706_cov31-Tisochrysis_lutea.AAC.3
MVGPHVFLPLGGSPLGLLFIPVCLPSPLPPRVFVSPTFEPHKRPPSPECTLRYCWLASGGQPLGPSVPVELCYFTFRAESQQHTYVLRMSTGFKR